MFSKIFWLGMGLGYMWIGQSIGVDALHDGDSLAGSLQLMISQVSLVISVLIITLTVQEMSAVRALKKALVVRAREQR